MSRFLTIAGLGYALTVVVLLFGLTTARNSASKNFATSDARRAWDDWRKNTESQEGTNLPVRRSIPRSTEPPTLVLLRDHYLVCTAASLALSTVLYWTIALFLHGIIAGPKFPVEYRSPSGNRQP